MSIEQILEECGGFGKFQIVVIFGIFIQRLTAGWSMLQMSYAGYIPDWYCVVGHDNLNGSHMSNQTMKECSLNNSETGYRQEECNSHYFSGSSHTVVTEWDLVCDRKWIKATITSIQMVGVLVGAVLAGQTSDTFGRKKSLFGFSLIHALLNFGAAFSTSWEMFAAFRFLLGVGIGAILVITLPYGMEFLPMKSRPVAGVIPVWGVGVGAFSIAALILDDWSRVHIACGICGIPLLLCYPMVHESIRWLTLKGRLQEAEDIVGKMASMNGKTFPSDTKSMLEKVYMQEQESKANIKHYSYWDLFKGWKQVKISLITCYFWFMISMVYYGISFGVSALAGNLYLNIFILSAIEIPAIIPTFYFNNKFGRKKTFNALLGLGGLFFLGCLIIQYVVSGDSRGPWITGFSLIAKMGIGSAWAVAGVWSSELFPTSVRSLGFGLVNCAARIGGIIAPFIIDLDNNQLLTYAVITGMVAIGMVLALFAPETMGQDLSDSLNRTSSSEVKVELSEIKTKPESDANDHKKTNN